MKLRFENIFEVIIDDPARAREVEVRANLLSAVRDLMVICQWDQNGKVSVAIDEDNIVISRAGLEPKYTLAELLEACDEKQPCALAK